MLSQAEMQRLIAAGRAKRADWFKSLSDFAYNVNPLAWALYGKGDQWGEKYLNLKKDHPYLHFGSKLLPGVSLVSGFADAGEDFAQGNTASGLANMGLSAATNAIPGSMLLGGTTARAGSGALRGLGGVAKTQIPTNIGGRALAGVVGANVAGYGGAGIYDAYNNPQHAQSQPNIKATTGNQMSLPHTTPSKPGPISSVNYSNGSPSTNNGPKAAGNFSEAMTNMFASKNSNVTPSSKGLAKTAKYKRKKVSVDSFLNALGMYFGKTGSVRRLIKVAGKEEFAELVRKEIAEQEAQDARIGVREKLGRPRTRSELMALVSANIKKKYPGQYKTHKDYMDKIFVQGAARADAQAKSDEEGAAAGRWNPDEKPVQPNFPQLSKNGLPQVYVGEGGKLISQDEYMKNKETAPAASAAGGTDGGSFADYEKEHEDSSGDDWGGSDWGGKDSLTDYEKEHADQGGASWGNAEDQGGASWGNAEDQGGASWGNDEEQARQMEQRRKEEGEASYGFNKSVQDSTNKQRQMEAAARQAEQKRVNDIWGPITPTDQARGAGGQPNNAPGQMNQGAQGGRVNDRRSRATAYWINQSRNGNLNDSTIRQLPPDIRNAVVSDREQLGMPAVSNAPPSRRLNESEESWRNRMTRAGLTPEEIQKEVDDSAIRSMKARNAAMGVRQSEEEIRAEYAKSKGIEQTPETSNQTPLPGTQGQAASNVTPQKPTPQPPPAAIPPAAPAAATPAAAAPVQPMDQNDKYMQDEADRRDAIPNMYSPSENHVDPDKQTAQNAGQDTENLNSPPSQLGGGPGENAKQESAPKMPSRLAGLASRQPTGDDNRGDINDVPQNPQKAEPQTKKDWYRDPVSGNVEFGESPSSPPAPDTPGWHKDRVGNMAYGVPPSPEATGSAGWQKDYEGNTVWNGPPSSASSASPPVATTSGTAGSRASNAGPSISPPGEYSGMRNASPPATAAAEKTTPPNGNSVSNNFKPPPMRPRVGMFGSRG